MIEVIRQKDNLNREVWEFEWFQRSTGLYPVILLRAYRVQNRASKRHKWSTFSTFNRFHRRFTNLRAMDVPLPEDVKQEVFDNFTKDLKVVAEYEK